MFKNLHRYKKRTKVLLNICVIIKSQTDSDWHNWALLDSVFTSELKKIRCEWRKIGKSTTTPMKCFPRISCYFDLSCNVFFFCFFFIVFLNTNHATNAIATLFLIKFHDNGKRFEYLFHFGLHQMLNVQFNKRKIAIRAFYACWLSSENGLRQAIVL